METTIEARPAPERFIEIVLADPELLEAEFDALVADLAHPPTASRFPADPPMPGGRVTPAEVRAPVAVRADSRPHGAAARPPPHE